MVYRRDEKWQFATRALSVGAQIRRTSLLLQYCLLRSQKAQTMDGLLNIVSSAAGLNAKHFVNVLQGFDEHQAFGQRVSFVEI